MHPTCFQLGPLTIRWYGVMMAVGFMIGFVSWVYLGKKENKPADYCSDLLFWIMVSGILGARVAYILCDVGYFIDNPMMIIRLDKGGLVYYGGFLGAGLAIVLFARKRKESLIRVLDFVITAVPLAHFFGRVGCFLNGCCYGKLYEGWSAVRYPKESFPWVMQRYSQDVTAYDEFSKSLHAVQLYEAVFNLLLFVMLFWLYPRRKSDGFIIGVYLVAYPIGRFVLEFFRGDERPVILGISLAQLIGVALLTLGLYFLWSSTRRKKI
jgi:phosphatidylglycerol:prolipoprotein diacylglycerol transferase